MNHTEAEITDELRSDSSPVSIKTWSFDPSKVRLLVFVSAGRVIGAGTSVEKDDPVSIVPSTLDVEPWFETVLPVLSSLSPIRQYPSGLRFKPPDPRSTGVPLSYISVTFDALKAESKIANSSIFPSKARAPSYC